MIHKRPLSDAKLEQTIRRPGYVVVSKRWKYSSDPFAWDNKNVQTLRALEPMRGLEAAMHIGAMLKLSGTPIDLVTEFVATVRSYDGLEFDISLFVYYRALTPTELLLAGKT